MYTSDLLMALTKVLSDCYHNRLPVSPIHSSCYTIVAWLDKEREKSLFTTPLLRTANKHCDTNRNLSPSEEITRYCDATGQSSSLKIYRTLDTIATNQGHYRGNMHVTGPGTGNISLRLTKDDC